MCAGVLSGHLYRQTSIPRLEATEAFKGAAQPSISPGFVPREKAFPTARLTSPDSYCVMLPGLFSLGCYLVSSLMP